ATDLVTLSLIEQPFSPHGSVGGDAMMIGCQHLTFDEFEADGDLFFVEADVDFRFRCGRGDDITPGWEDIDVLEVTITDCETTDGETCPVDLPARIAALIDDMDVDSSAY